MYGLDSSWENLEVLVVFNRAVEFAGSFSHYYDQYNNIIYNKKLWLWAVASTAAVVVAAAASLSLWRIRINNQYCQSSAADIDRKVDGTAANLYSLETTKTKTKTKTKTSSYLSASLIDDDDADAHDAARSVPEPEEEVEEDSRLQSCKENGKFVARFGCYGPADRDPEEKDDHHHHHHEDEELVDQSCGHQQHGAHQAAVVIVVLSFNTCTNNNNNNKYYHHHHQVADQANIRKRMRLQLSSDSGSRRAVVDGVRVEKAIETASGSGSRGCEWRWFYRYQDVGMLDGSVVRLWDNHNNY